MDKRDRASLAVFAGFASEIAVTSSSLFLDDLLFWYIGQIFVAGIVLWAMSRSRKK